LSLAVFATILLVLFGSSGTIYDYRFRILVAVALTLIMSYGRSFAQDAVSQLPFAHITISGSAFKEVQPDLAEIRFGVVTKKPTAKEASTENAMLAAATFDIVRKLGIDDKDVQTINTDLSAVFIEERDPKTFAVISRRPDGYQAINLIAVRIRDIRRVGEISSALIDQGVNRFDGVSFEVSDREKRLDAIREEAILDAKRKADIYVRPVSTKLGDVYEIQTENNEPPGSADMPTRRPTAAPQTIVVPIAPGTTELSVTVKVTWKLTPR
jgi:uncharacterized protein YggE